MEMTIFDSVQAVLKKELNQYLKKDTYVKLKNKMKYCKEPFGVFHSETGDTTIIGSLAAIYLCQQHLTSFLRNPKTSKDADEVVLKMKNETVEKMNKSLPPYGTVYNQKSNSPTRTIKSHSVNECELQKLTKNDQTNVKYTRMKKLQSDLPIQKLAPELPCKSECTVFESSVSTQEYSSVSLLDSLSATTEVSHMKYACRFCPFKSMKEHLFLKHERYHGKLLKIDKPNLSYDCEECGDHFDSDSDYQKHQLQCAHEKRGLRSCVENKDNTKKNFTCEICGFGARLLREYKKHIEIAHPITYSCPQCEYKSCKKVHYLRHVRNVHDNKRPCVCKTCGAAFKRRDALKQHEVIHVRSSKARTPFQCKVCSKVVRSASYLREHMLTHSDERSFLCEICGASFKTRSVHRNHMKVVHSQSLQALCKFCNRTFATKYSLSRHISQHGNRKSEEWTRPAVEATNASSSSAEVSKLVFKKGDCIIKAVSNVCNDKTIDSMYTDFSSPSDNFNLSIDNQIPYIIHSTQEVTTELVLNKPEMKLN